MYLVKTYLRDEITTAETTVGKPAKNAVQPWNETRNQSKIQTETSFFEKHHFLPTHETSFFEKKISRDIKKIRDIIFTDARDQCARLEHMPRHQLDLRVNLPWQNVEKRRKTGPLTMAKWAV